jgi:hypothetical protein
MSHVWWPRDFSVQLALELTTADLRVLITCGRLGRGGSTYKVDRECDFMGKPIKMNNFCCLSSLLRQAHPWLSRDASRQTVCFANLPLSDTYIA